MMSGIRVKFSMDKHELNSSYDIFIYKAVIDLTSAKCLLKAFNNNEIEIDIEKIYFELQQSAEKYLKARLCKISIDFPKSHDIEQLIDICREHQVTLNSNIEILIELSDYAVEGRYAVIHDDIDESDKYIALLEELYVYEKDQNN